ncbi:uncharacterized protein [Medicago truncatula]|uniref:uncharacterized protein n=1 Tax=Medicago truncatula TaxID=3880 RepID=UPI000D2F3C0E|nr:uncharacterized protein LOC112420788 [Medicago truncatula]
MLIGDFNETLLPSDQRGGIFNHSRATIFANFLDNCNLLDLTTTGTGRYTWHRNNNGRRILSKKLDKAISNMSWRLAFPEAFIEILCRLHSDHNPILLRFGGLPLAIGPRPFRFEAAWIDHEDYYDLVTTAWNSSNHNPTTALKNVRESSIIFNQEVFGNIFKRKRQVEKRLKGVQQYFNRVDSIYHALLEKDLQREYNDILFQEEMHRYQKSREQWVKFGDKNNAFFHAQTIIRRKRNKIHRLQLPNVIWSTDSSTLQEEAQRFFKNLFCSNQHNNNNLTLEGTHPTIDVQDITSLTNPITKAEVTAALNSMKLYKSSGPDGFQCIFFKQYWHIVGEDIFQLVKTAFETCYFDPALSDTLIALILKEIIHHMRRSKKKKGQVAFKLDFEKAFDNAKNSQLRFISDLFDPFGLASGLKINLSKSRADYSAGTPQTKINRLTSISGIRSTTSLDKYLSFPILKRRAKQSDFLYIIEKMQTRLAYWKNKLLNKPGRLTLASSVLSAIPSYYMQITWLPQNICDSIDQTTRNFIWRDSNNKGIHLVGWNKITRPKHLGGLGIRPAREANISLLGKLVWELVQSSNKLWVNLLSDRYVSGPRILLATTHNSASATWSSIIKAKDIIKDGFFWRAGSGSSSFWSCPWSSFGYLGPLVPYIDIHDIQLTVKDVISSTSPHTQILYTQLPPIVSETINNTHFKSNASLEDAFIWTNNKNGNYATKSGYLWLLFRMQPHSGFNDPDFFSNLIDHDWLKDGLMGPQCFLFASMVENFKICFKPISNDTLDIRFIKWNNNNFSSVILNVDGSCLGSPIRAGFGGVLRNYASFYLSGFSGPLARMNIDAIVCYSDSLHGINLIKGPPMKYHVHVVLIQDIKDLLEQNNIIVCHTLREGNQCADFMVKLGSLSNVDLLIHPYPPDDIMSLLKNDAAGTFFPRN